MSIKGKDKILVRLDQDLSRSIRDQSVHESRSINSFIVNAVKFYITKNNK